MFALSRITLATVVITLCSTTMSAEAAAPVKAPHSPAAVSLPSGDEDPTHGASPTRQRGVNPLVEPWGVFRGLSNQLYQAYEKSSGTTKQQLNTLVEVPKSQWFGAWIPNNLIRSRIRDYIDGTQKGDPRVLVQMTIFRVQPWNTRACSRLPTSAEKASYKDWINQAAAEIGSTRTAITLQPDAPFATCAPGKSRVYSQLVRYATKQFSSLPYTSVYIEAGAADWLRDKPSKALRLLIPAGIRMATGFAFNGTHYDSTARQIRYSAAVSRALARKGMPGKTSMINTAQNGTPFKGYKYNGPNYDHARICKTRRQKMCVSLGIPPTTDVANARWGLSAKDERLARKYVDAYIWFGRPWLYEQASPFDMKRALTLVRVWRYR